MNQYLLKVWDGNIHREKVLLADSYDEAQSRCYLYPPGYIWIVEPMEDSQ